MKQIHNNSDIINTDITNVIDRYDELINLLKENQYLEMLTEKSGEVRKRGIMGNVGYLDLSFYIIRLFHV